MEELPPTLRLENHLPDYLLSGEVPLTAKYDNPEDCTRHHLDAANFVSS